MTSNSSDQVDTPEEALFRLKEGNFRFINNMPENRDLLQAVSDTRDEQKPYAAILSCMDSRTSAELIFDQGVGDVFSIRIAGNVITEGVMGSLEYATAVAGSKLILVLGHTNCGAIKGACDRVRMGHLSSLLEQIEPAMGMTKGEFADRTSANNEYVAAVTRSNVKHSMDELMRRSSIVKELVDSGKVAIEGAIYDVATGKVTFNGF
ncbi:MAG: carbonic anhydrase [Bacteroidota bacterium]